MLKNKLDSTEFLVIALHEVIRIICLKFTFNEAFSIISSQSFCLQEAIFNLKSLRFQSFQSLANLLYKLDEQEKIVASCYSVALTIFYIAASQNCNPYLVIGLNKVDKKLLGHAWVELPKGELVNPGGQELCDMSIIHKWQISDGMEKWLKKSI